eukprot:TRINITY_DN9201_c0_g1_i1.p1 TRINITY_DN9201_c0_g1~~TRINITY_DN9201_c0_g1_i1.p1  ORF type:complete len:1008 (-),score=243.21 TRINITY_DN9201_c0_g1_i1:30-3053(-)
MSLGCSGPRACAAVESMRWRESRRGAARLARLLLMLALCAVATAPLLACGRPLRPESRRESPRKRRRSCRQAPAGGRRLLLSSLHPISRSGYGQQTQLLVQELQQRGWEVSLLTWNIAQRGDAAEDLEALLRKHGVPSEEVLRQAGYDARVLLPGVPIVTAKLSPPQGFEKGEGWLDILRAAEHTKPDVILHLHDAWWLGAPPAAVREAAASGKLPPRLAWLPIVFDPLLSDDPKRPDRAGAALEFFNGVIAMSLWGRGVYESALAGMADGLTAASGDGRGSLVPASKEERQATAKWLPPLLGTVRHALHPAFEEGPLGSEAVDRTRKLLGLPEHGFVVLVVGRNPPPPSTESRRKSHQAAVKAFVRFKRWVIERCASGQEVVQTGASVSQPQPPPGCPAGPFRQPHLHLHCDLDGGVDLRKVLAEAGLPVGGGGVSHTKEQLSPEQLRALYGASDVLLQLSRAEGFGLPVVEAQACGVPVIANGATAMAEHVVLGQLLPLAGKASGGRADRPGSWTPPDVQAAAEALLSAWQRPPSPVERNLARMALAAELSSSKVAAGIEAHLLTAISGSSARRSQSQAGSDGADGGQGACDAAAFEEDEEDATAAADEDAAVPARDGADNNAAADAFGRAAAATAEPDPRPICSAEYRTFAATCLSVVDPHSAPECIQLQDAFRACLRRDWTRLGAGAKPRLPYPKGTEALHRQVSTRFGAPMLYSVFDLYVGRSLEVYGEWLGRELRLHEALLGSTNPGATVVEIGANIGALTVPLALRVSLRGRVVAFEADRVNSQLLAANVALAQLLNVETIRAAVGATPGWAALAPDRSSSRLVFSNLRALRPPDAELVEGTNDEPWAEAAKGLPPAGVSTVQRTTLDLLTSAMEKLDLVKIATPGAETAQAILRGAPDTLRRLRPWLLVELPSSRGDVAERLSERLGDSSYECSRCDMLLFNGDNWRHESESIFHPASATAHALLCGHETAWQGSPRAAAARRVCEEETAAAAAAAAGA